MRRLFAIVVTLWACAGAAMAQVGQFPGVAPPVPSPQATSPLLGGAPPPPAFVPAPVLPPSFSTPSQVVTTRRGRTVLVPGGPPDRNSFSDRVERCVHAGTAAGVRSNHIDSFTAECAN
ncbi:MAG TPA: hypothetical protein VH249_01510 [Xanthobacteraceae bacterium]|jgi:hypothetical protein|nr:hypothetical protein [Xanthobacteraceae bacterium]